MKVARPIGERCVAAALLGLLALNPPILSIFNAEIRVFGIPLLYLYLFLSWGVLIVLTATISGVGQRAEGPSPESPADPESG